MGQICMYIYVHNLKFSVNVCLAWWFSNYQLTHVPEALSDQCINLALE